MDDSEKKKKPKKKKLKKGEQEISVYETLDEPSKEDEQQAEETDDIEELEAPEEPDIPEIETESETTEEQEPQDVPETDEKPDKEKKPPKEWVNPFKKLTVKHMAIIAGVIGLLIIVVAVFGIIYTRQIKNSGYPEGSVILTLPESKEYSASYIFTSRDMVVNGVETKLLGVLVDQQACVFYFNRQFKVNCMDFTLMDSSGNIYYMDLTCHMGDVFTDKLYFQPLNEGVSSFAMQITNSEDGSGNVNFYFDRELEYPTAYYAENQSVSLGFEGAKSLFKINEAAFSSAGTFIDFSFSSDSDRIMILPGESSVSFLKVMDNSTLCSQLKGYKLQEEAGALVMGKAGFRPLKTLDGTVAITVRDLICRVKIDKYADTPELFLNEPGHVQEIRLGDYKLVLERMGKRGLAYVAVVHMENLKLPVPQEKGDYFNRIYASYEMELVGKNKDGETVTLKSEAYLSKNGADIVFFDENKEIVFTSPEDVELKIISAEIEMDDVVFELNINSLPEKRSEQVQKALNSVLMLYEYDNSGLAMYTAQVMSYSVTDNNGIAAVIYEAGMENGEVFYKKQIVSGVIRGGIVDILSETDL